LEVERSTSNGCVDRCAQVDRNVLTANRSNLGASGRSLRQRQLVPESDPERDNAEEKEQQQWENNSELNQRLAPLLAENGHGLLCSGLRCDARPR
jgi:hypothetical protein